MPIQPMSLAYDPIPDIEDVTPLNGSIHKQSVRSYRKVYVIGAALLVAGLFVFYRVTKVILNDVKVYQTSMKYGDEIRLLDRKDMARRGFDVGLLDFGNTQCGNIQSDVGICRLPSEHYARISVNPQVEYQEIIGFGGAFTEAAAHNFYQLSAPLQEQLIEKYFGKDGIGFTLGRVHINSCDFSLNSYSFDNVDGDVNLLFFDNDVTHDTIEMLPFMKRAMEASAHPIRILASPWSPPAWMKVPQQVEVTVDGTNSNETPAAAFVATPSQNNLEVSKSGQAESSWSNKVVGYEQSMLGSAAPNGLIATDEIQTAWALYISKFISAYKKHGVDIWAITPQNEPEFAAPWEACKYSPDFEMSFIQNHLGPRLNMTHPEVLILAFDHNKDDLVTWTSAALYADTSSNKTSSPSTNDDDKDNSYGASQYVDGMAFHWYQGSGDRELDGTYGYNSIRTAHSMAPGMIMLATEGCSCPGVEIGSLTRAERLGHDIMFDLLNFAQGWIDWNLLVDYQGGPNHLNNFCDAAIVCSQDFNELVIQPKYHYFGHFSKFVPPGSVRVQTSIVGDYKYQIIDPNVRAGLELGMFACEHSTRQQWIWRSDGSLQLAHPAKYFDEQAPYLTPLCLGSGDDRRSYLRLVDCKDIAIDDDHGAANPDPQVQLSVAPEANRDPTSSTPVLDFNEPLRFRVLASGQFFHEATAQCVVVADGGDESGSGALLVLGRCIHGSGSPILMMDDVTEEVILAEPLKHHVPVNSSAVNGTQFPSDGFTVNFQDQISQRGLCLTAGWPFFTAAAFRTPKQETVVVVMNEASVETSIVLGDVDRGSVWFGIPEHSIQTIVY